MEYILTHATYIDMYACIYIYIHLAWANDVAYPCAGAMRRPEVWDGREVGFSHAFFVSGNTSFTSPEGNEETGHSGNGYARITLTRW